MMKNLSKCYSIDRWIMEEWIAKVGMDCQGSLWWLYLAQLLFLVKRLSSDFAWMIHAQSQRIP